ncbi:MAG: DUF3343 domain-containing protein [Oscillospiraceae bacterium]
MGTELIYTFSNTHYSISAEKALLEADVPVKVMPLPSAIRAGCGLCLRMPMECDDAAGEALRSYNIPLQQRYKKLDDNGTARYISFEEEAERGG